MAKNYESLRYYHVDFNLIYDIKLLDQIKEIISYSIPIVFGLSAYNSIEQASDNGMIPLPERNDKIIGGHAVLAIGYDDHIVLSGNPGSTTGAFLIRNSWGTKWGQGGYGWLPYEYLLKGLTKDW